MPIFISHSFENLPEFENVTDALKLRNVPFWNPAGILAGAPLREQLRAAVQECCGCIFVATRASVGSSWCGSELGAFWGAAKPIIVYLAEASLPEKELPDVVQGDVWQRSLSKIAERARQIWDAAQSDGGLVAAKPGVSVAQLTVEQLEKVISGAVSLAAATAKERAVPSSFDEVGSAVRSAAGRVLAGFQASETASRGIEDESRNHILWVDDRPQNNVYERRAMEAMGFEFTLALSTDEALKILESRRFAAIISDMGRREGPREGYKLLAAVRAQDKSTPYFIYAGSNAPEHKREAAANGAQGSTNIAEELVEMVTRSLSAGSDRWSSGAAAG